MEQNTARIYCHIIVLLSLLLTAGRLVAIEAPKYSNEFLSVGVGARALGMGNSVLSSAQDAGAAYWNPSLLLQLATPMNASLMHAEYFAGVAKYDYGGFAYRLDTSTALAVSLVRFGIDNIPNTTDLIDKDGNWDYGRMSYFSAADYALYFSLARYAWDKQVSLGINAKLIYRSIGQFASAYGFGIDVAAHYQAGAYSIGATVRDITTTFNVWSLNADKLSIPEYVLPSGDTITNATAGSVTELTLPKLCVGVSRAFALGKDFGLLTEVGFDLTTDGQRNTLVSTKVLNIDPRMGIEADFRHMVFVRFGLNNAQRITDFDHKQHWVVQPNAGVGFSLRGFTLDYALSNIGSVGVATYSHIFSLSYAF